VRSPAAPETFALKVLRNFIFQASATKFFRRLESFREFLCTSGPSSIARWRDPGDANAPFDGQCFQPAGICPGDRWLLYKDALYPARHPTSCAEFVGRGFLTLRPGEHTRGRIIERSGATHPVTCDSFDIIAPLRTFDTADNSALTFQLLISDEAWSHCDGQLVAFNIEHA